MQLFRRSILLAALLPVAAVAQVTIPWDKITGEPTTAAGYGITNGANIDAWGAKTPPSGNIVIASGKTATVSNTLAFTGTDSSSVNFGAGGDVMYSGREALFTQSVEQTALSILAITPATAGAPKFETIFNSYPNGGSGNGVNHTMWMGWNPGRHNSSWPVTSGYPTWAMGMERNFYDDTRRVAEWYVQYFSPDGTSVQMLRPIFVRAHETGNTSNAGDVFMNVGTDGNGVVRIYAGDDILFYQKETDARFTTPLAVQGGLLDARNGLAVTGAQTLPTATGSGIYFDVPGSTKRIFFGDGTGHFLTLARRTGGSTTDLITFGDDGSMVATGNVTLNGSGNAIKGTTTNNNAAAGYVGEFTSSTVAQGSAVNFALSGTGYNITSLSLGAGDWDLEGIGGFVPGVGVSVTQIGVGISTTSGAQGPLATVVNSPGNSNPCAYPVTRTRISLASTTTVYLAAVGYFSGGTLGAYGYLSARRVR